MPQDRLPPHGTAAASRRFCRVMTPQKTRPVMFGFLCAGCGRCLEELPAWQLGAERFYCGIFCREVDEHLTAAPDRRSRTPPSG